MSAEPDKRYGVWLTEASTASVEMARLAGYGTVVLDVEHGVFDLAALDWMVPFIRAQRMDAIVKVLGPERGPIQQALDFGASGVAIPHIESAEHAQRVCGYAKFPPRGDRSFAGGRTSSYGGFTDGWVNEQDLSTRCYPMIEDASAFADIEAILRLPVVDGIFVGPSDLSLRRDRGAYSAGEDDFEDLRALARAAETADKPWILPAWSPAEQQLAVQEGATLTVLSMQYGAMLGGFTSALTTFQQMENDLRSQP